MLLLICKVKRHKESYRDALYKSEYRNSLEVSCSFLVRLPNWQVFAVNNILKIQNFIPFWKSRGWANEGAKKIPRRAVAPRFPVEPPLLFHKDVLSLHFQESVLYSCPALIFFCYTKCLSLPFCSILNSISTASSCIIFSPSVFLLCLSI